MKKSLLTVATAVLAIPPAVAQSTDPSPAPTQSVVAGRRYGAGAIQRMLFGDGYRKTWTTPVRVPVLDLGAHGGLRPTRTSRGKQTLSLRFAAGDGRQFRFRSVEKDTTRAVPKELRDTVAEWVIQDQISATYPAAALVVDGLNEATGIYHVEHALYVMPDDARLGEFRDRFKGRLGILEETPRVSARVTEGFEGASEIIETNQLIARMDASAEEQIDARAFVKGRLLDFVTGDWDRHQKQWMWVRRDGHDGWLPFVVDSDMACADYDGVFPTLARTSLPTAVTFNPGYRKILGLCWNSREVDRRLLASLERPAYMQAAAELQSELTDAVIEDAVRRLPAEYYARDGAALAARLKQRRDRLADSARRFYELLAREIEVRATDGADVVDINRTELSDTIEVRITRAGDATPF